MSKCYGNQPGKNAEERYQELDEVNWKVSQKTEKWDIFQAEEMTYIMVRRLKCTKVA